MLGKKWDDDVSSKSKAGGDTGCITKKGKRVLILLLKKRSSSLTNRFTFTTMRVYN